MKYEETKLAYAAGIIDGEGCVGIYKNTNSKLAYGGSYRLVVEVGMSDCEPLAFMHKNFGGYYQVVNGRKHGYKKRYMWGLGAKQAQYFLEAILPYLLNKKIQVELAIEFQKRRNPGGSRPTRAQYQRDIEDSDRLKQMKRREAKENAK